MLKVDAYLMILHKKSRNWNQNGPIFPQKVKNMHVKWKKDFANVYSLYNTHYKLSNNTKMKSIDEILMKILLFRTCPYKIINFALYDNRCFFAKLVHLTEGPPLRNQQQNFFGIHFSFDFRGISNWLNQFF